MRNLYKPFMRCGHLREALRSCMCTCLSWRRFMTAFIRPLALTFAAAAVAVLSACVVAPAHRVYPAQPQVVYPQPAPVYQQQAPVQQNAPQPVTVYQAPPPPQQEVYGVAPGPGYFWISGVWLWEGNRHVWRPGRWEQHRQGQVYQPHGWVRAGKGWQIHGGHWR
jgi:hypothetical protein